MQIRISARHGHLSDASRDKITEKVEKLSRIFDRLTAIDVTVDLEHDETPTVDLRVSAEHKHDFVATDRSTSLMGSIDTVLHKMERQLRRYKERIQSRHRVTGARDAEATADAVGDADETDDGPYGLDEG